MDFFLKTHSNEKNSKRYGLEKWTYATDSVHMYQRMDKFHEQYLQSLAG